MAELPLFAPKRRSNEEIRNSDVSLVNDYLSLECWLSALSEEYFSIPFGVVGCASSTSKKLKLRSVSKTTFAGRKRAARNVNSPQCIQFDSNSEYTQSARACPRPEFIVAVINTSFESRRCPLLGHKFIKRRRFPVLRAAPEIIENFCLDSSDLGRHQTRNGGQQSRTFGQQYR